MDMTYVDATCLCLATREDCMCMALYEISCNWFVIVVMEGECYFDWKFGCNDSLKNTGLINIKAKRIQNIIRCSQLYQDNIHERLQLAFDRDSSLVLQSHKVYVWRSIFIQRKFKRLSNAMLMMQTEPKIARRSELPKFSFLQQGIYCGEECQVQKDKKNPSRWRPAYICAQ